VLFGRRVVGQPCSAGCQQAMGAVSMQHTCTTSSQSLAQRPSLQVHTDEALLDSCHLESEGFVGNTSVSLCVLCHIGQCPVTGLC
jgi:hypothetical protein